ncbi:Crp/Fnr family transcriptional regulator [Chloroflexota bacterium]
MASMAVQLEFLRSIAYFSRLNLTELDSIGKLLFEKTMAGGEIILFEGEPAEVLYFVASGMVKVFKTSADGKEQILYFTRPGESFNDVSVLTGGQNLASAQTVGQVVLYGMKKGNLEIVLRDYSRVALNVINVLSQRVKGLVSLVEDLSFRRVTNRVARILLERAADGTGQKPRLTQQEMAAMAGTAREMVGRSLKALEEEGVIRLERHRIMITDKEALREMAGVVT